MKKLLVLLLVFVTVAASAQTEQISIKLKSGDVISGTVIEDKANYIKIQIGSGQSRIIYKSDIDSMDDDVSEGFTYYTKEDLLRVEKLAKKETRRSEIMKRRQLYKDEYPKFNHPKGLFLNTNIGIDFIRKYYDTYHDYYDDFITPSISVSLGYRLSPYLVLFVGGTTYKYESIELMPFAGIRTDFLPHKTYSPYISVCPFMYRKDSGFRTAIGVGRNILRNNRIGVSVGYEGFYGKSNIKNIINVSVDFSF